MLRMIPLQDCKRVVHQTPAAYPSMYELLTACCLEVQYPTTSIAAGTSDRTRTNQRTTHTRKQKIMATPNIRTQERPPYHVVPKRNTDTTGVDPRIIETEDAIVTKAIEITHSRMLHEKIDEISGAQKAKEYLKLKLGQLDYELFGFLALDIRNRVVGVVEMFRGTVAETHVHPREVVKELLHLNASGVVFFHNHPGGSGGDAARPSGADKRLTKKLTKILDELEVKVLDHFIIAGTEVYSMAEGGDMEDSGDDKLPGSLAELFGILGKGR